MIGNLPAPSIALTRALKISTPLLAFIFLVEVALLFATDRYNWDLDHEMYFGQRLLNGDLLWTQEYHDKLPFLQILFAVPAWFKSIQVWRLMSLTSCLFAAISIPYLLPRIFTFPGMSGENRRNLLISTGLLYLVLCMSSRAGLTHINPMATSFSLIATLLMMFSLTSVSLSKSKIFAVVLVGGLLAAAAISIRPYFVAPLILTVALGAAYPLFCNRSINLRHLVVVLSWGGAVVSWGLILNFLPYLSIGSVDAFVAGLQILQQKLNPQLFSLGISNGNFKTTFFTLTGLAVLLGIGYRPSNRTIPFLLFILASAAVLLAFTIQKHWWAHYIQFFYGYFSLTVLFLFAWLFEGKVRSRSLITFILLGALAVLVGDLLQSTVKRTFRSIVQSSNSTHRVENILQIFQGYRAEEDRSELTFLAPHFMYLHWQLDEPRHGFPHAANTGHIFKGWWQNIAPSSTLETPKDNEEYCHLLAAAGPEIVVAISNSPVTACFQTEVPAYQIDAEYPIDDRTETLLVFRRN